MRKRRHSEKEIMNILKEARLAPRIGDMIRRHHINPKTYYRWKAKYGMGLPAGRLVLRHLRVENESLKLLVAKQALEIEILRNGPRAMSRRRSGRKSRRA